MARVLLLAALAGVVIGAGGCGAPSVEGQYVCEGSRIELNNDRTCTIYGNGAGMMIAETAKGRRAALRYRVSGRTVEFYMADLSDDSEIMANDVPVASLFWFPALGGTTATLSADGRNLTCGSKHWKKDTD